MKKDVYNDKLYRTKGTFDIIESLSSLDLWSYDNGQERFKTDEKIYISAVSDGIVTRKTSGGDVTLYLKNAHGDVVQLTNGSGDITKQYSYDAFGNVLSEAASGPFGYCGELDKHEKRK